MPRPALPPLARAPRCALLFSGHMIDSPGRCVPRFPASKVPAAMQGIESALDMLEANAHDVALTQGAAGGDILFAEACVRRGVPVQLLLPLPETQFIARSILASADAAQWQRRFLALKAALPWPPQVLEPSDQTSDDPFERCNQWLLDSAMACGARTLHLISLWNGDEGDGPGGTAHMVQAVARAHGQVTWIDTRTL